MEKPRILLAQEKIASKVDALAKDMNADYRGKRPLLVGILKGCFVLMADLIRRLDLPVEIEFVTLASYGDSIGAKLLEV